MNLKIEDEFIIEKEDSVNCININLQLDALCDLIN